MAKKGAGFRLWFRKLNIKRFHTIASQRKRRSSPHHHHLHSVQISSPYHTLNSYSNPSSPARTGNSPPAMIFSSSSSPQHTFVAFSPSPWRHSFPALSPVSHTSPCTSPTPPRCSSGAARHSSAAPRKSQHQASSAAAMLLISPFNRKAMDIHFPSGGSSPATFLQSPLLLHAAPIASPARNSPPLRSPLRSARSHTILFRSPLHPLAQPTLCIAKNEPKSSSKQLNTAQSLDGSSREAKISVSSSINAKVYSWASRKSVATACHSQAQYEEASYLTQSTKRNSAQQMPIRAISTRPSSLVVDCGCRPNLSSSFRKTKKTLQACGSCSSNKQGVIPVHDRCYEQAMQKLRSIRGGHVSVEESKNLASPAACNGCQEETCILFSEQGHHGHGVLSHKVLQQLRKRKKKMHSESPMKTLNPHDYTVHTVTPSNVKREGIGNDSEVKSRSPLKDGALGLIDTQTLPWDKEFSSFTSEDTFFSSFERSRPSFSSNSSSECFDKKLCHSNLALKSASAVVSNTPETPYKNMLGNHEPNTSNPSDGVTSSQDVKSKGGDPLIEVRFHSQVTEVKGAPKHGFMAPSCRVVSSERRTSGMSPKPGAKRSCLNPLVGIKEVSCEEGNVSTPEQGNLSRERYNSNIGFLNMQKKSSLSPDYIFGSHSDYYASARAARPTRHARARKKSSSVDVVQGAGDDTGSARVRRRAQLQAKWMLRDERIQWQSSVDESEVDAASNGAFNEGDTARSPGKCVGEISPICCEKRVGEAGLKFDATKLEAGGILEPKLNASIEAASVAQTTAPVSNISDSERDGGKEMSASVEHANAADTVQSSSAKKSRLMDSVAVVKSSRDPLVDFRDSMVDMIIESQIYSPEDLGELLRCFLSLNPSEHHNTIVRAFMQVWSRIFQGS